MTRLILAWYGWAAPRRVPLQAATNPVDVQMAPGGELFYADFNGAPSAG